MDSTPNPGFTFPTHVGDRIDSLLRASSEEPVRSVRPERQAQLAKPVVPSEAPAQPAPVMAQPVMMTPQVVQPEYPSVQVQQPTPAVVPTEEYTSIDLPSRFHFYPFKDLYVKPFRVQHLAKLAKAEASASMQMQAEVVGSVLMTPTGTPNPVMLLSMADLNAVMLWLRLNSFTKKTMRVTSNCTDPKHHAAVKERKLPESSLKIETSVDETQIEIIHLDHAPDPEHYCIRFDDRPDLVVRLRPERVQDAIEFLDHPLWADEEFQYLARIAASLDLEGTFGRQFTLNERIEFVKSSLSNDDCILVNEFNDLMDKHGVVESVATKCKGCGASGAASLAFDARTFLSPSF